MEKIEVTGVIRSGQKSVILSLPIRHLNWVGLGVKAGKMMSQCITHMNLRRKIVNNKIKDLQNSLFEIFR